MTSWLQACQAGAGLIRPNSAGCWRAAGPVRASGLWPSLEFIASHRRPALACAAGTGAGAGFAGWAAPAGIAVDPQAGGDTREAAVPVSTAAPALWLLAMRVDGQNIAGR